MIKIKLSKEIEDLHFKYFKDNIASKFNNEIDFREHRVSKLHKKFMKYCNKKSKTLAIGSPSQLENFCIEIPKNFKNEILNLINSNKKCEIKQNTQDVVYKKYSDILYSIFGYDYFKTNNFFDYLLNYAKDELTKKSHKKINYCKKVQDKIIDILKENFPEYADIISCKFDEKYNENDLKKQLEKIIVCDITIDKFKNFNIFKKSWNPYAFVIMSGIRVCPYCNRQYITPIFSNSGKMRADLDHFLPKSKYPYFSMSLYNLIPCCKFCNSSLKGTKEFKFDDINPYEDSVNDYMKFKADPITNEINIIKTKESDSKKITNYLNYFKLKTLYNYHQNQVKELIEKRVMYPDSYIKDLFQRNKDLLKFKNEKEIKALIIGYIEDESKINDEAFLKLRRDIAEQLHFIDSKQDDKQIKQLEEILGNR